MSEPEPAPEDLSELGSDSAGSALEHGQFGSLHIKLSDLAGTKNLMIAALGTAAAAYDLPLAAGASAAAAVTGRVKHLSLPELFVFDALRELCGGGSIYKVWIDEDVLVASIHEDLSTDESRRLIANMKSRGILEEGAGMWRAVW